MPLPWQIIRIKGAEKVGQRVVVKVGMDVKAHEERHPIRVLLFLTSDVARFG